MHIVSVHWRRYSAWPVFRGRHFFPGMVVAALAVGAGSGMADPISFVPCCSDPDREVRSLTQRYPGELIDIHTHLDGGSPASYRDRILKLVSDRIVDGMVLMPTPNHGRQRDYASSVRDMADLAKRSGDAIKNFCGAADWNVWLDSRDKLSESSIARRRTRLEAELAGPTCIGIGEIATRHFEKWPGQHVLTVDFESNGLQALFAIAHEQAVPIDLHVEPMTASGRSHEQVVFSELDELFARYPGVTVILSHTGMTRSENVARLIKRYPGLHFNIKLIWKPEKWRNLEPATIRIKKEIYFYEDWAQLFEDYPERFLVGSDYKFARRNMPIEKYQKLIKRFRNVLGSLEPGAAALIAHGNAQRLFQ